MKYLLITLSFLFLSSPAFADIKLKDVHAFETSEGMKNGAVLLAIENTSDKDDKLIEAKTPACDKVEIHQMKSEDGIMKMREVGAIAVKAGENVILEPNGYHLMLLGLKKPLVAGKSFPITLKFENGGEILTTVRVRQRGGTIIPPADKMHHDMKDMDMAH